MRELVQMERIYSMLTAHDSELKELGIVTAEKAGYKSHIFSKKDHYRVMPVIEKAGRYGRNIAKWIKRAKSRK